MTRVKAATAKTSRFSTSMANGSMAAGSRAERVASCGMKGFSTHQAMAPVRPTFTSDFTNCISPSGP
jgi:hypothetical protein